MAYVEYHEALLQLGLRGGYSSNCRFILDMICIRVEFLCCNSCTVERICYYSDGSRQYEDEEFRYVFS
jgi:hypothetical protein